MRQRGERRREKVIWKEHVSAFAEIEHSMP
jgi:hypothetical protein